jgi:type III secretion protein C
MDRKMISVCHARLVFSFSFIPCRWSIKDTAVGLRRIYARCINRSLHITLAVSLLCTAASSPAFAQDPIVGLEVPVSIQAREQPVAKFIRELFAQMSVPVHVGEGVRGAVNGDFDKPAGQVLDEVRKAFQLTYYYDGAVLYVYPASELSRNIMYMPAPVASQVIKNAQTLNLTDSNNHLEAADLGLIATGTRRFLEQIRELTDAVQSRTVSSGSPETFRVFKLKYGWAGDVSLVVGGQKIVVPGVASLLANLVGSNSPGSLTQNIPTNGVQREPISPAQPKLKGQGLQSVGLQAPLPVLEQGDTTVRTTLSPGGHGEGPTIVADPLNNAVVIRDRTDRMPSYERLIESLDVEPQMVEIEATIIDMNTDRLRELGVEWRLRSGESGSFVDNADVTPIGDGGIVSLVLGDRTRFISRVRALEEQGAARIVSKPHVITLANVEAVLDSTSTFFVRVEGQEEVDLFDVSVGTTMRVTPHVHHNQGENQIKLLVGIEDGSTSDQRVDQIPVIDRSTINTQALVEEGQSLLIGGLIRESDQNSVSKVPVVGDIPGIGALFRSNAKSNRRTERLFLITPRITNRADGGDLRLDAPIRIGNEAEIVSSAPLRLESVKTALTARDESFPVKQALPQGSIDADLTKPELQNNSVNSSAPVKLERRPRGAQQSDVSGIGG